MVIEVEQDFPRGGTQKLVKSDSKKPPKEKDLFQIHPPEKKKRKKKASSKITESEVESVPSHLTCNDLDIEPLTSKLISEGMLICGVVCNVQDYKVYVSLPNFYCGNIPISKISNSYTRVLEHIAENQETDEQILSLQDMFTVGSVYTCKVVAAKEHHHGKLLITLTTNPSDVNEFLRLEDIEAGRILQVAVVSKEDHGYVMDSGIKGFHAFLSNEDALDFINERNNGQPLGVGQILRCAVKTVNGNIALLSAKPKRVSKAVLREKVPFHTIQPGNQVSGTVLKVTDAGLYLNVFEHIGIVQKLHLQRTNLILRDYKKKDEVVGHVLYIHPVLKVLYISLQPHLSFKYPKQQFTECQVREVVDDAEAIEVSRSGFFLRIKDKYLGYCKKYEAVEKVTNNLDLKKKISVGSLFRCRILTFSYVDNVIVVTIKKSKVYQKYSSYEDLKPGDEVKCEVIAFHPKGMVVEVGYNVRGLISNAHNADFPLKFPDKKFKIKDILHCRVLKVIPSEHKLTLTNKQTLVKSKIPPLTSYEDARVGQVVEGVIVLISSSTLLVAFYNDVRGVVTSQALALAGVSIPSNSFYIGQVITCYITKYNSVEGKLFLSLTSKESFLKKITSDLEKFPVGSIVDCKILSVKKTGLDVLIFPSEIQAFLPLLHLSDHHENCRLLLDTFKPDSMIKGAFCFGTEKQRCIVSLRPSLCNAVNHKFGVGKLVPGIVESIDSKGIHVSLIKNKKGLIPNILISEKHNNAPLTPVHANQKIGVECKIIKKKKELFILSISLEDCYSKNPTSSISSLMSYLKEHERIKSCYNESEGSKYLLASKAKPGLKLSIQVKEINEVGLIGCTNDGVTCIVSEEHLDNKGNLKVGDTVEGMVLFANFAKDCLELTLKSDIMRCIIKYKKNSSAQVKEDQVFNGQVLLRNEIFILVMLKGPAAGNLVYVPSQLHPNDLLGRQHLYTVGADYRFVIKRIEDPFIVALAESREGMPRKKKTPLKKEIKRELPVKIGEVAMATITKIFDFQMNIVLPGKFHGRIFVTEVTDSIEEGQNPLKAFKGGAQVKVRVIGFRSITDPSNLPLSHHGFRELAECSMRESILSLGKITENSTMPDVTEGDIVNAYVKKLEFPFLYMHVSHSLEGRVTLPETMDKEKLFPLGAAYCSMVIKKEENFVELSIDETHTKEDTSSFVTGRISKYKVGNYLVLKLPHGYKGVIFLTDLTDRFKNASYLLSQLQKQHKNVRCSILEIDHKKKRAILSLRKSRVKPNSAVKIEDPEIVAVEIGKTYHGFICSVGRHGLFVLLGRNLEGFLPSSYIPESHSDLKKGMVVQVTVADIMPQSDKILLLWGECEVTRIDLIRVRNEAFHMLGSIKRKRTISENSDSSFIDDTSKRRRTDSQNSDVIYFNTTNENRKRTYSEGSDTSSVSAMETDKSVSPLKPKEKSVPPKTNDKSFSPPKSTEELNTGENIQEMNSSINLITWRSNLPVKSKEDILQAPCLELEEDFFWSKETIPNKPKDILYCSSSSDECDQEDTSNTKKKKTRKDAKQEEEQLYKMERILADEDRLPQTVDDFDRLVMSSPDSSIVWLKYMAFHLQQAEVDKARAVAERALQTINFREEQEKFNVWIALLNLENLYGSAETLQAVFKRALQSNEPLKVYKQLANIYIATKKPEQAEELFNAMIKRFSLFKDVWISYAIFLMRNEKFEAARNLLQRSLRSLPQKDSVEVISKFAQLEFKYGHQERGRTMFESILSNYPKRSDLWSIYIDMMLKTGDVDAVRQIFERVITLQVSVKKMKFFFKKYLNFEKQNGDDASVEHVKQKALEYVDAKNQKE